MKMQNMLPSLANPSQLTHGGVSGVIGALTDNSNSSRARSRIQISSSHRTS